jgi:hypothetical protein
MAVYTAASQMGATSGIGSVWQQVPVTRLIDSDGSKCGQGADVPYYCFVVSHERYSVATQ